MKINGILCLIPLLLMLAGCEKGSDNQLVIRLYGDALEDVAYSIAEADGDIVIAGQRSVITRRDGNYIESYEKNAGLIKAGPAGLQKWQITPGGNQADNANKVFVLPSGDILITGYTTLGETDSQHTDIYIVKTAADGTVLWESVIGGSGNQVAYDIMPKQGGGFMIAGTTDAYRAESGSFSENIAGMTDFLLLHISESGDSVASYAFGYGGNDICASIKRDIGGGYVLFGTTDNSSEPGLDKNNLLLIRLNEDSSNRGAAIVGDLTDEYGADFEVLPNGYLLAATIGKENESNLIGLMKLSTNIQAQPVFYKKHSINALPSTVNALAAGAGGTWYLGGRIGSPLSSDMLIIKVDSDGDLSGSGFISGGSGSQEIFDLFLSESGFLLAAGKTGYENNSMMCLLKLKY
ncbi:MAG: hypothetical protein IH591_18450 [Bacteroidales bacterium]|nr:hypothetical protein [Bacteroidales bacterium]